MVGFNRDLFFNIDVNTDLSGLNKMVGQLEQLEQQANSVSAALAKMGEMQRGFQAQTVPDLRRGASIFAGPEGGPRQQGRALSPLNNALQEAQQMSLGANEGLRRYRSTINDAGERVMQYVGSQEMLEKRQKNVRDSNRRMGGAFGKTFGILMNTMFIGMALSQTFGRLTRKMLDMFGVTDTFGAAFTSILIPVFQELAPILNKIALGMTDLPKGVKMAIGAFIVLMSVLGPILFFGSQLALLATSGLALGTVATVAGVAAGALAILVSGFKLGTEIGKRFSAEISAAMTFVGGIFQKRVSAIIQILSGLSLKVDGFIQVFNGLVRGNLSETLKGFEKIFRGSIDIVVGLFNLLTAEIQQALEMLAPNAYDAATEMMSQLVKGIREGASKIEETIKNTLPNWAVKGLKMGLFTGGMTPGSVSGSNILTPNDFILTDDGKMIQPHKDDTLIGTKNPGQLGQSGDNQGVTINIQDNVMKEDIDVQRVVDEVEDRVNRDTRGRSGGLT